MNERYKLPIPLAALFAFVALGGSYATSFMMLHVGNWRLTFEQAASGIHSCGISESLIAKISLFVAIGVAAFVFRFLRSKVSYTAVFNTCFLTGLALLCYSAWILPFIIRLLNSDLQRIDKFYEGWIVVWYAIGPGLCMCILNSSAALLLLAFATLYDKRTPHKCKCQPNETP